MDMVRRAETAVTVKTATTKRHIMENPIEATMAKLQIVMAISRHTAGESSVAAFLQTTDSHEADTV